MVRNLHSLNRYAFTMIELIFAIVIIAVSVMSLPVMTQVISKGMEGNLAQEAIFTSIAEINMATTYTWDEVSLIESNTVGAIDELSRVVNTNTANDCADPDGDTIMRRTGHVNRRCLDDTTVAPFPGLDSACNDSINTAVHAFSPTYESEGGGAVVSAEGYKRIYESELIVTRCDTGGCINFGAAGVNENINMKEIKVSIQDVTDPNDIKLVTLLRTYVANIGEVAYHTRTLP